MAPELHGRGSVCLCSTEDSLEFYRPTDVTEVLHLLTTAPDPRVLAGGQSLVPAMNMAIAEFGALISLQDVATLREVKADGDGIVIGAMVTHRSVEDETRLRGALFALREAATTVAHPAVRAMGTIGGSVCHADPAADYPGVLVALGAMFHASGPAGSRQIPAADFFVDMLTTALKADEIVTAIRLDSAGWSASAGSAYEKLSRVDGDYAVVSATAAVDISNGICTRAALALGSCGSRPVRLAAAEDRLVGTALTAGDVAAAGQMLAEAADPPDDIKATANYRRRVIPTVVARAIARAKERAGA